MSQRGYSQYYHELDCNAKKRYEEKLSSIGENIDDTYMFSADSLVDITMINYIF